MLVFMHKCIELEGVGGYEDRVLITWEKRLLCSLSEWFWRRLPDRSYNWVVWDTWSCLLFWSPAVLGVGVLWAGQCWPSDSFSKSYQPLHVPIPRGDVPSKDALYSGSIKGFLESWQDMQLPQLLEMIHMPSCLPYCSWSVKSLRKVLADMYTKYRKLLTLSTGISLDGESFSTNSYFVLLTFMYMLLAWQH